MRLLPHYIKEIISAKEITSETLEKEGVYMHSLETLYEVILLAECSGTITEHTLYFTESRWEQVQKQGYFLA